MPISPVSARSPHSADMVHLFQVHTAMHDERDERDRYAGRGPAGIVPSPAANGAPPSAALPHPTRRPAYLVRVMSTRGPRAGAGRADRFAPHGEVEAAEPPGWERMAPGERGRDGIPADDHFEVPLQAESVHGRRVGAEPGQPPAESRPPPDASRTGTADRPRAREAVLGRLRCLALMARVSAPVPLQATFS